MATVKKATKKIAAEDSVKRPAAKKSSAKTPAKRAAETQAGRQSATKVAGKKAPAKQGTSLAKGKDPKGGLTAEGRRYFKETQGLHLRPGVKGEADTPEKMVRKGSFLRRHYANPPGPVKDAKEEPTRQALQAAAWGEPVPQNEADERRLAEKGSELLEQYHAIKDGEVRAEKAASARKGSAKKAVAKGTAGRPKG